MTEKEKEAVNAVIAVWRGIPARYIASTLMKIRRGVDWTESAKADMADAVADKHKRYGDYGNPENIAVLARAAHKSASVWREEKLVREAQSFAEQERRALLNTMTSAQLDGVFKALEDRDIEAEGPKVTLSDDWYLFRRQEGRGLQQELARVERVYKVRLIMALEERMRDAKAIPVTKEKV